MSNFMLGQVAISIRTQGNITAGRQFDLNDAIMSKLTRRSIDIMKNFFRDEMRDSDWDVVRDMKAVFDL